MESLVYRLGAMPDEHLWAGLLPAPPCGVGVAWLREHVPVGAWVVLPFAAVPDLAVEAAQAGYRVLVITPHPVLGRLLEGRAQPPPPEDLRAALAALAGAYRGAERLERAMRGLYATPCPRCGRLAEGEAFLWEQEDETPRLLRRRVRCAACNWAGEVDATPQDAEQARLAERIAPLRRARLAERVLPLGHPDRPLVEETLTLLPPRTLEALALLLAALSDPQLTAHRTALTFLVLASLAQALPLEAKTGRPVRTLRRPRRYWERNLWLALEHAPRYWQRPGSAVPFTVWPALAPPRGGVTWFPGRVRAAQGALQAVHPAAVFDLVPTLPPSFWVLSAWAVAWLWGREQLGPLVTLLTRRRYDATWLAAAWTAALHPLAQALPEGTPWFALLPEADEATLSAFVAAAHSSGWCVEGAAPQPADHAVQWLLRRRAEARPAVASVGEVLRQHNAPVSPLTAWTAALLAVAPQEEPPEIALRRLRRQAREVLAAFPTTPYGAWLPLDDPAAPPPLYDRVEETLLALLRARPHWPEPDLLQALMERFPGLETPDLFWVRLALTSYADATPRGWQLRPGERLEQRAADLARVRAVLRTLGERLGYTPQGDIPLRWEDQGVEVARFYPLLMARAEPLLREAPPGEGYLILPGSRALLWLTKVERDPRLAQALDSGRWRVLKFRHVLQLGEIVHTREDWLHHRDGDPFRPEDGQQPLW